MTPADCTIQVVLATSPNTVEREGVKPSDEQPGLREFLKDRSLSGNATPEEVEFLKQLRFKDKRRPTALFYYRELQNLRDPLHFRREQG